MGAAGVIPEIKSLLFQSRGRHLYFSAGVQFIQYAAVFAQYVVYPSYIFVGLAVAAVVVGAPALVGAESLVDAAPQGGATFFAGPVLHDVKIEGEEWLCASIAVRKT